MKSLSILHNLSLLICLLAIQIPYAQAEQTPREFPRGCEQTGYSFLDYHLDLKPVVEQGDQTLYLFRNTLEKKIYMKYIEMSNAFMVPDWHTELSSDHWAAFATDKKQLYFECSIIDDKEQKTPVSCKEVLHICEYSRAKFAEHNRGNYWIATDETLDDVVNKAINNGILLRW